MSESDHSRTAKDIYDLTEKLKFTEERDRILSLKRKEHLRDLRVSAWSVRWVLSVRHDARFKRVRVEASVLASSTPSKEKTFVLYRRLMLRLLRWPKPAFDQLAIELPCLMGFRAKEVCTWRAEYIDWVNGETLVLDAKKHRIYSVPLNNQVARHAEEVLNGRGEGYVLQSRSTAWTRKDKPLSTTAIWYIWDKWTKAAGIGTLVSLSPVVGRRFFAAEWFYGQGLSLVTLQRILRHTESETTLRYVRSLVFFEDVKRDYDRFQLRLMQDTAKEVPA